MSIMTRPWHKSMLLLLCIVACCFFIIRTGRMFLFLNFKKRLCCRAGLDRQTRQIDLWQLGWSIPSRPLGPYHMATYGQGPTLLGPLQTNPLSWQSGHCVDVSGGRLLSVSPSTAKSIREIIGPVCVQVPEAELEYWLFLQASVWKLIAESLPVTWFWITLTHHAFPFLSCLHGCWDGAWLKPEIIAKVQNLFFFWTHPNRTGKWFSRGWPVNPECFVFYLPTSAVR